MVEERFPALANLLWFDRPGANEALGNLRGLVNEFETDADTGRGSSYRHAQLNRMVRAQGIRTLFTLAAGVPTMERIPSDWTALDLLGGDGLLTHVFKTLAPQAGNSVITSDMAGHMVADALSAGLPAIRQQAQFLFMRDESVDAVMLAYGTHHIPREDRPLALLEAARVVRPGGLVVLHDFEEGSPVARWFSVVVDQYSKAGHRYDHFTVPELEEYFALAGLRSVSFHRVYDPLVMTGDSADQARWRLAAYLTDMYGLDHLAAPEENQQDMLDAVWELARNCFSYGNAFTGGGISRWKGGPEVYSQDGGWVAEVPRVALVAVGRK
jgi:SAM-dependent methyltransferase